MSNKYCSVSIRRSQTTINISAWGSILKSGVDLPWSGTAYVKCDGLKKVFYPYGKRSGERVGKARVGKGREKESTTGGR